MRKNIKTNLIIPLLILILSAISIVLSESSALDVKLYYSSSCPFCKKEISFLDSIKENYSLDIIYKEIDSNITNRQEFESNIKSYQPEKYGIPAIIVGDKMIVGFSERIGSQIKDAISDEYKRLIISDIEREKKLETEKKDDFKEKTSILLIAAAVLLGAIILMSMKPKKNNKKNIKKNAKENRKGNNKQIRE